MKDKTHIATLDGLRGIAAFAVVWYHMTAQLFKGPIPFRGYLAVDFFFVLSGLVVARAYEHRLLNSMSIWTFTKIRLIRLYPMIVLGVLFGAVSKLIAYHHFHQIGASGGLSSIFMAIIFGLLLFPYSGMYGPTSDFSPLDIPLWSLMFELWANIFYAATVRISRWLVFIIIPISAVAIVWVSAHDGNLSGGHTLNTFGVGVIRVGFSFFLGIALERLLTPIRINALPSVPASVLALALIATIMAGSAFGRFYDAFTVLIIFPAIVALGTKDCISPRWKQAALISGALSYPVYVLHYATFVHFTHFKKLPHSETLPAMVFAFVGILVISYISLHWYDEPVRKWLTKISKGSVRPITQDGVSVSINE